MALSYPTSNAFMAPTVLDLFSGAGGTGLGFQQAGFRIVGAVELHPSAAETYRRNLCVDVTQTDIRQLNAAEYRERLGLQQGALDVLVGCPPCQGFSRMRNMNGAGDERNNLVLLYLSFVREFAPRFALFENVPGLIRSEHGKVFCAALEHGLRDLGYTLVNREVDAADYGTPQHRKRVIVIAARDGGPPPFPEATHTRPAPLDIVIGSRKPWATVRQAIGNGKYPSLTSGEDGQQDHRYPNHVAPLTGPEVLDFIRRVPHDGGGRRDVSREYWLRCHLENVGHSDVYGRVAWDRPSNTLTQGCVNPSKGRFVHPDQDRALTPREAAALQGFPNDFIFHGDSFGMQIGNAVPPPLAYAIAVALKDRLLNESASQNRCIVVSAGNPSSVAVPAYKSGA